jgi:hypothetical protein
VTLRQEERVAHAGGGDKSRHENQDLLHSAGATVVVSPTFTSSPTAERCAHSPIVHSDECEKKKKTMTLQLAIIRAPLEFWQDLIV